MKCIGIRVIVTQETDKYSHKLFEAFNVREIQNANESLEKDTFDDMLDELRIKTLELIKSINK